MDHAVGNAESIWKIVAMSFAEDMDTLGRFSRFWITCFCSTNNGCLRCFPEHSVGRPWFKGTLQRGQYGIFVVSPKSQVRVCRLLPKSLAFQLGSQGIPVVGIPISFLGGEYYFLPGILGPVLGRPSMESLVSSCPGPFAAITIFPQPFKESSSKWYYASVHHNHGYHYV